MEKNTYVSKHPILSVVWIEVSFLLVVFIAGAIATIQHLSYTSPILISFIPTVLVLIFYFTWKRRWTHFGFTSGLIRKNWLDYTPLLLILVLLCFQGFTNKPIETIVFYVGFAALVGFVEESIYRGLIVKILLPKGIIPAVLTSSLLFSFTHILNLLSGQGAGQMVLQLIYAFLMGIVLAQLMIKNGSILPLILFHTIHNLIQFLGKGEYSPLLDGSILVILAIMAVYLAVPSSRNTNSSFIQN